MQYLTIKVRWGDIGVYCMKIASCMKREEEHATNSPVIPTQLNGGHTLQVLTCLTVQPAPPSLPSVGKIKEHKSKERRCNGRTIFSLSIFGEHVHHKRN